MSDEEEQNHPQDEGKEAGPNQSRKGSTLRPGSQIGSFRIERELGRGGEGVVYLAHDTKLDRSVALKSLPPEVMDNPKDLSRIAREARVLASLNHPNIATIYDEIEEAEGSSYMVLEYIPGQTLTERLAKGPLKLEEALTIALQITEAVAAAHEHDVIHRDLKPGNIRITPEGKVKVLDFGLAKAIGREVTDEQITVTAPGRVIGTPAYMSPEQARGKPTDKRSDIWSFGCILYQMLTAKIPFEGDTVSDSLANILQTDPDWQALPGTTPANIRSLLRRCLEKDPRRRLQHIGDAGIEIHETLHTPAIAPPIGTPPHVTPRSGRWKVVALCVFAGLVVGAIAMYLGLKDWIQSAGPEPIRRYSINLQPENPLRPDAVRCYIDLTFTPDGRQLIYVAGKEGDTWLVARQWDSIETQRIRGTEDANWPQVSPDGQWLTFTALGVIYKVPLTGGTPERITDNPFDFPFTWKNDHTLFLSTKNPGMGGLSQFDLRTLESKPLTTLDATPGVLAHAPIQFDQESGTLFYIAASGYGIENYSLYSLSLENGRTKLLVDQGVGFYAASGHLVYAQKGRFMAVPFDIKTLETTGPAICLMEKRMATDETVPNFSFSNDGTLIYAPARGQNRELVWVDFEGREEIVGTDPLRYKRLCVSDDKVHPKFAAELYEDPSIWIYDINGESPFRPLIFSSKDNYVYPVWMPPDNREIIFASHGSGNPQLYRKAADGSGEAEDLLIDTSGLDLLYPHCSTPDGNVVLATTHRSEERLAIGASIVAIHLERDGQIEPLLLSDDVRESHPTLSKDGKWLAYVSLESNGVKVFVTSYPDLEGKWLVSDENGFEPVWAPDGKALYYRDGNSIIDVPVQTEGGFSLGRARALFEDVYVADNSCRTYDIHPDGKRFLMMKKIEENVPVTELIVVENWFEELKRQVPTKCDE